jgi:hypothetical protein
VRRCDGEIARFFHFRLQLGLHLLNSCGVGEFLFDQPIRKIYNRISIRLPQFLLLLRTVVFAIDVTYVMTVITVSVADQKAGTVTTAGPIY